MNLVLASVVFLLIGYFFGFYVRSLWDKLQLAHKKVATIVKKQESKPQSSIIEAPLTPAERVAREQEELLERLNPQ